MPYDFNVQLALLLDFMPYKFNVQLELPLDFMPYRAHSTFIFKTTVTSHCEARMLVSALTS